MLLIIRLADDGRDQSWKLLSIESSDYSFRGFPFSLNSQPVLGALHDILVTWAGRCLVSAQDGRNKADESMEPLLPSGDGAKGESPRVDVGRECQARRGKRARVMVEGAVLELMGKLGKLCSAGCLFLFYFFFLFASVSGLPVYETFWSDGSDELARVFRWRLFSSTFCCRRYESSYRCVSVWSCGELSVEGL